jgi:nicotinic acid mononucleotide adenylyltransferase
MANDFDAFHIFTNKTSVVAIVKDGYDCIKELEKWYSVEKYEELVTFLISLPQENKAVFFPHISTEVTEKYEQKSAQYIQNYLVNKACKEDVVHTFVQCVICDTIQLLMYKPNDYHNSYRVQEYFSLQYSNIANECFIHGGQYDERMQGRPLVRL